MVIWGCLFFPGERHILIVYLDICKSYSKRPGCKCSICAYLGDQANIAISPCFLLSIHVATTHQGPEDDVAVTPSWTTLGGFSVFTDTQYNYYNLFTSISILPILFGPLARPWNKSCRVPSTKCRRKLYCWTSRRKIPLSLERNWFVAWCDSELEMSSQI